LGTDPGSDRPPGQTPLIVPFGDSGVFVELGGAPGIATSGWVQATARAIRAATEGRAGWSTPIPAATSILVPVDPVEPGAEAAVASIRSILGRRSYPVDDPATPTEDRVLEVPVRFGGDDGPDLETVATMTGLRPGQVIEALLATTFTALFLGFAPGFAYLGPLDERLILPRRDAPRQRVPAGSVAIAGPQAAIYPVDSPGGWWILGRTALRVWDPNREPAALINAGTRIRFVAERA